MIQSRTYSVTAGFMLVSFAVFAALWFYCGNRYFVLHWHEQIQLFQFNGLYFRSYIVQAGGLSEYLGAFLTQFYHYPLVGSMLIAAVLASVVLLLYRIYGSYGLFFLPFVPAVLLMMSFANSNFYMSAAVGICLALSGFRLYTCLTFRMRYIVGLALHTLLYFTAGGNALLLTAMILIFECAGANISERSDARQKRWIKYLYLLLLMVWSALLPWIIWRAIFTVPLSEAYFALTPLNFLFPTAVNQALWLSIPLLYLIVKFFANKIKQWKVSLWKLLVTNCLLVIFISAFGSYSAYDRKAEMLNRMAFDLQRGDFESVLSLGKNYPNNNRLAIYLTNIALAESGQMPYRMFQFRQTGSNGLFLDWQQNYYSSWYLGEVYYRFGIIPEAEHCAFEALVSSPREQPNAQCLQRLTITNIVRRDSLTADKYLRYFEHTLAYRKWARQQRENLILAMADTAFHIPETPVPSRHSNFFVVYQQPDYTLVKLLEANPKHVLAFQYLMSYYMLQKDIGMVKWCMDTYYNNFDYPGIPTHYEEALIVYDNMMQEGDEVFEQYPVSQATRARFERYAQAYKAAQGSKRNLEQLEKQFGNTYWYYAHFINPFTLQNNNVQNRY